MTDPIESDEFPAVDKSLPEYPFDLDPDARFGGVKAAMDYLTSEGVRVTALQVDEAIYRFFQTCSRMTEAADA